MFCNDVLTGTLLKLGSSGTDVIQLQKTLNYLMGYSLSVTGYYDIKTYRAVRHYQSTHHLSVDGIVGKDTGGSLCTLGVVYAKDATSNSTARTYPLPTTTKTLPMQFAQTQTVQRQTTATSSTNNVALPGSKLFGALSMNTLKDIPSWVWYGLIGLSVFSMVGHR